MAAADPLTHGVHHVGLSVPDVARAAAFFVDVLGFALVRQVEDYPATFVSDGAVMLTLWQVEDPARAAPFDRRHNIGLHHLALQVADDAALERAHERLRAAECVDIEFPPSPLRGGPTRHMMCCGPGGIRLELIAPA